MSSVEEPYSLRWLEEGDNTFSFVSAAQFVREAWGEPSSFCDIGNCLRNFSGIPVLSDDLLGLHDNEARHIDGKFTGGCR
jgi:hypothetical protein